MGSDIYTCNKPNSYFINKIKGVLNKQGQIEPLQVDSNYVCFNQEPYGAEIIEAAKELGWTTLLVSVMDRYEY